MELTTIRPIVPDDTDALIALADSIELFSSDELEELRQMLADSLGKGCQAGYGADKKLLVFRQNYPRA